MVVRITRLIWDHFVGEENSECLVPNQVVDYGINSVFFCVKRNGKGEITYH